MLARLEPKDRVDARLVSDGEYWRALADNEPLLMGAAGMEYPDLSSWRMSRVSADDPLDRGWSVIHGLRVFATPDGPKVVRWRDTMPNHHSVTFDAKGNATVGTGTASSLTVSITVASNSDRYLGGFASHRGGQSVSSATYNAVALTARVDTGSSVSARVSFLDQVAPSTGTNNLVFNFSAATNAVGGGHSLYGAHQTSPRRATGNAQAATSAGVTEDITTSCSSAVGDIGISGLCLDTFSSSASTGMTLNTPDVDYTSDWYTDNYVISTNNRAGGGYHTSGVAGTLSITHNVTSIGTGGGQGYAMVLASIQPSSALKDIIGMGIIPFAR